MRPHGEELSQRLASVLEVVYLIFNEGYTAARGDEWLQPQLCNDAAADGPCWIVAREPEAHGLLALVELNTLTGSRRLPMQPAIPFAAGSEPRFGPRDRLQDPARHAQGWAGRASLAAAASMPCRRRSSLTTPRLNAPGRPTGRLYPHSTRTSRVGALAGHRTQPRGGSRHGRAPPRPGSHRRAACG